MKKYIIVIEEGLKSQPFEVENMDELNKKIQSGQYSILHVRGKHPIKITPNNIKTIIELP